MHALQPIIVVGLVAVSASFEYVPLSYLQKWIHYQSLYVVDRGLPYTEPWQPSDHCVQRYHDTFSPGTHNCDVRPQCGAMTWTTLTSEWLGLSVTGICYPTRPDKVACTAKTCPSWAQSRPSTLLAPVQRVFELTDGNGVTTLRIRPDTHIHRMTDGSFRSSDCAGDGPYPVSFLYTEDGYDCVRALTTENCGKLRDVVVALSYATNCTDRCEVAAAAEKALALNDCDLYTFQEHSWDGKQPGYVVDYTGQNGSCDAWRLAASSKDGLSRLPGGLRSAQPSILRWRVWCEPTTVVVRSPALHWLTSGIQEISHGIITALTSSFSWLISEDLAIYEWFFITIIGAILWVNRVLPLVEALVIFVIMSVRFGAEWPASLIVAVPVSLLARFIRDLHW